ncbi:MAG TPA: hypothetical protein VNM68_03350, partial [Candidatus Polarisedimenticolia bacterium]|nr:hypothetical protein [Candidatus Polarisedimenticolia bacterium]
MTDEGRYLPRAGERGGEIVGEYPIPLGSSLRAVECVHCHRPMGVSSWDYWNGFLVVCPHCLGKHGKPWAFERTILSGLFLNVFSFFFTLRPRQALIAIIAFVLADWILIGASVQQEGNDPLLITSMLVAVLGPVLVNAVALVRHQIALDKA